MKQHEDFTHKAVKIEDIRLRKGKGNDAPDFYAIKLETCEEPLYVNSKIFNERVNSYFLSKNIGSINDLRQKVLSVKWNFLITNGYYLKFDKATGSFTRHAAKNQSKSYVSFLEIAGNLGEFDHNFKTFNERSEEPALY